MEILCQTEDLLRCLRPDSIKDCKEVFERLTVELLKASGQCVQCFQVFIQGILILEDTTDRLADFGSVQSRHALFWLFDSQPPQCPGDFDLCARKIKHLPFLGMAWEGEDYRG